MVLSKKNVTISVQVDKNIKELLVRCSKEFDLTLSKFARNLIYVSLRDYKLLKLTGFIPILKQFFNLVDNHVTHEGLRDYLLVEKDNNPVTISVVIDSEVKKTMEQYAEYLGLPLNIFGRNLIYVGLDTFKIFEKVGLIKVSKMCRSWSIGVNAYLNDDS